MTRVVSLSALAAALGCAQIAGVSGEYREVASEGGAGSGGTAPAGGNGGAGGVAGSSGLGGGGAGSGGTAGASGSAGGAPCASLGKQCVSAPEAGWSGPLVVLHDSAAAPASCTAEFPTQATPDVLHGGLGPDSPTCGCACDPPTTATCSAPQLKSLGSVCLLSSTVVADFAGGGCKPAVVNNSIVVLTTPGLTASACPIKQQHQLPPPTWQTTARACTGADASGTCESGNVCLPQTPPAWRLCIYQSGDVACPSGSYTEKQLLYDGVTDDRACSPCSCGAPQGNCGGFATLYVSPTCNPVQGFTQIAVGSGCVGPLTGSAAIFTPVAPTPTCQPSTSTLTGSLTPKNPITFCCDP